MHLHNCFRYCMNETYFHESMIMYAWVGFFWDSDLKLYMNFLYNKKGYDVKSVGLLR
jgi:hypothetical protein